MPIKIEDYILQCYLFLNQSLTAIQFLDSLVIGIV